MPLLSVKSLAGGDSSNVYSFSLQNHWGTHVDMPNHVYTEGLKVIEYPADFWIFRHPQTVEVELGATELLRCGPWLEGVRPDADILLIRTGWHRHRGQDIYSLENPGIDMEVGFYLRKNRPAIRAVGIDCVSISSYRKRDRGRAAHRAFLDPEGVNNPIVLIEDMDLGGEFDALMEVWAFPMLVEGIDGAPCTVIGSFRD